MNTWFNGLCGLTLLWVAVGAVAAATDESDESGEGSFTAKLSRPSEQFVTDGVGRIGIEINCDGEIIFIAFTNKVPTMIKSPSNFGNCHITLECRQNRARTGLRNIVGIRAQINSGNVGHSFSCGTNTDAIVLRPENTGGNTLFEYVP